MDRLRVITKQVSPSVVSNRPTSLTQMLLQPQMTYRGTDAGESTFAAPAADADLREVAKEHGIEFFLVCFVDIKGVLRSKMVPASAIGQIQKDGAGFAPFASWLDYGPDAADLIVIPDPSTFLKVAFQPELGFVIGDAYIAGKKVLDSPRWVLKEQVAKAAEKGYVFKTGVECEFFLLADVDPPAISDSRDRQEKPCYDAQSMFRRYEVLKEIVQTLNAVGYGIYQIDHEDANGQFEINWHYSNCLQTADRMVFFKWVVKSLAERHGYRATFMPRPFADLTGNGCHSHCSLWSGDKNLFVGDTSDLTQYPLGLSQIGLNFLGGILAKTVSNCAITNPTVNSYRRIAWSTTASGSTWAPNRVAFSGNNRTFMVRVPEGDRFEVRLADGSVNAYLLPAVLLAAGLYGLEHKLDPKPQFFAPHLNMYNIPDGAPELKGIPLLPASLPEALRALEADQDMPKMLNPKFVASFLKLKKAEWAASQGSGLTKWELENTLDC